MVMNGTETRMSVEEFIAAVDWGAVAAGRRETRAEIDTCIAQHVAELRAVGRPERLADKELMAGLQRSADVLDWWIDTLGGLLIVAGRPAC